MASISPTAWVSQQVTPNHEIPGKVWFTKEELDQPYDVTWIVKDGDFQSSQESSFRGEFFLWKAAEQRLEGVQRRSGSLEDVYRLCHEKHIGVYIHR